MKLQILSDLHIEFAPYKIVKTNADVIILAGDIHLGFRGFRWSRENFPNKKVIYVLGNHEFYNEAIPRIIKKLQDQSKGTNVHTYRKIQPSFTVVWHNQSKLWLANEIESCREEKIVIVSHHCPSIKSIPANDRNDPLTAAYASNLNKFISMTKADLWVHGHIHKSSDYKIGQTRVICNPYGYPGEINTNFDPTLVIEI